MAAERRQTSPHEHYSAQVDKIIKYQLKSLRLVRSLKGLALAAQEELAQQGELTPEQEQDLKAHFTCFRDFVTRLEQLGFLEQRQWTQASAQTIFPLISRITEIGGDVGDSNPL